MTLEDVVTGATLDVIGVDDDGQVVCVTGAGKPVLDTLIEAYAVRGLSPLSLVDELDGWTDGRVRLTASPVALEAGWVPPVPGTPLDLREAGRDRPLRRYWTRGEGALKIGWGAPGDFRRCVVLLGRYVRDPKGLCAEYHKAATGMWPGDKRNR